MINIKYKKYVLSLSVSLAVLIIIISCAGLFIPGTYTRETPNWAAQALGQDIFDLFLLMPCLVITGVFAYKSKKALLLWGGSIIYSLYTFLIYAFAVHFNNFFILYCFALGLSFYSFIYFLLSQSGDDIKSWFKEKIPAASSGIFLIIISVMFYFLWLSDIIQATASGTLPKSVLDTGLPVNPVHVIDLSLMLPALFITGVLLLKKRPLGLLFAAPMLMFNSLMSVSIGGLVIIMNIKGIHENMSVAVIMGILAVISIFLLVRFLDRLNINK